MIQSVAVLGAGAVGSYVIWGLSSRNDIRLGVIAEGERAVRLKKDGCVINDTVYHPEVWAPQEAHDVDLLIVCLKYGSLQGALDSIKEIVGEHTTVMSLMNGVDSEEIIDEKVGESHVIIFPDQSSSHKEETVTILIRKQRLVSFSESYRHRMTVIVCGQLSIYFRIPEFIIFRLNIFWQNCGASSV